MAIQLSSQSCSNEIKKSVRRFSKTYACWARVNNAVRGELKLVLSAR